MTVPCLDSETHGSFADASRLQEEAAQRADNGGCPSDQEGDSGEISAFHRCLPLPSLLAHAQPHLQSGWCFRLQMLRAVLTKLLRMGLRVLARAKRARLLRVRLSAAAAAMRKQQL